MRKYYKPKVRGEYKVKKKIRNLHIGCKPWLEEQERLAEKEYSHRLGWLETEEGFNNNEGDLL